MSSNWNPPPEGSIQDSGGSQYERTLVLESRKAILSGTEWPKATAYIGPGCLRWLPASREPSWYQTSEEGQILFEQAEELTSGVESQAVIFDYGSANCSKVLPLLQGLERRELDCWYICVDVSKPALEEGIKNLQKTLTHVKVSGIWGTFDDAKKYLQTVPYQRVIWAMGSTLSIGGRLTSDIASSYRDVLRENDLILAGQDCTTTADHSKMSAAYSTECFKIFIEAGIEWNDSLLGLSGSWRQRWDWQHQWKSDAAGECHVILLTAKESIEWEGGFISKGSTYDYFPSFKYKPDYVKRVFAGIGMHARPRQTGGGDNYIFEIRRYPSLPQLSEQRSAAPEDMSHLVEIPT